MPERLNNGVIDIAQRQALITALPVFSILSPYESEQLAALMTEVHYAPGTTIVVEEALVDSVFIIANGQAEATHQFVKKSKITKRNKIIRVPLAILGPGEAIGLNDTGFFSGTGKRTATVTATTEIDLLMIEMKQLHEFLQKHPNIQTQLYAATTQMMKVRVIKQSLPFAHLSHERLLWLASQVEEITVPAGTILFKQGEIGDRCYLIRSGQIEIFSVNGDSSEHQLAILKTPTLFGEATLMTRTPRNASARTLEDSQLLVLRHEYLSELIESESNVASMFMTLMVDRSRPLQNPNVKSHARKSADGQEIIILKNPDNGSYFKLSNEGWFIWQQLNGEQTMQEITLALADKFEIFAPDVIVGLISKLAKGGFITNVEVGNGTNLKNKPIWVRAMLRIRKILEVRVAFGDADKWLSSFYNKFAYLLFKPYGVILISIIALWGFIAFGFATYDAIDSFQALAAHSWILLIFLIPFSIVSYALHELGHALATKAFGHEVHYMGVGWYWFGPIAFTDTSDMWLSTRWPRILVNLAGPFIDIVTAGIASILILLIPNIYIQGFLWIFAIYTYINAFRMMSPLQELDGYYALMDLVDRPHLRQAAVVWLVKVFPKSLRQPSLFKNYVPEITYWLACIFYLILTTLLVLFVQSFIFKVLQVKPPNHLFSLAVPFFIVIISSLGVIADIRSQSEE